MAFKKYANLLPKPDQSDVRMEKITSRLLNLLVWVALSLAVLVVLLLGTRIYLASELGRVKDRIVLQQQAVSKEENLEIKRELEEFNTHLANLAAFEENQGFWSEIMINFARLLPSDLVIDTLSADRKTGQISITGFSSSRDSVLMLRENLLTSDYFENVNFPLSNLTRPTDVNFRYTFFVNNDLLVSKQ